MSDVTPHLGLPLIAASQAQKHVTHNEALGLLDALVQLACLDKDLTAPPPSPAEGDRYLVVASNPGGAWTGLAGQVVRYADGVWTGAVPRAGWFAYVMDEADLYVFDGAAWASFRRRLTAIQSVSRLGINTEADATDRLAVKTDAALLTWDDVTPGSGDMRVTLNKKAAANDAVLVFQTGYASRALVGTLGGDGLSIKVSPDGSSFVQALSIRPADGWMTLNGGSEPQAPLHVRCFASGQATNQAMYFENYGGDAAGANAPIVAFKAAAARGLPDAPLPIKAADRVFGFFGAGRHGGGGYSGNAVGFNGGAEEDFTASAWGTNLDFQTTPLGGTGRRSVVKFRANGSLELQPQASDPAAGVALGQVYANSTATAIKWYDGASWVRINNFAKSASYTSFDNYIAANAWTKVQFNNADGNDQGAFEAGKNRFVALEAGLHGFDVALTYKRNGASAPTAFEVQLYRNGAAAGRGRAAATGALVDGISAVNLATTLKLAAKDYVEVFVRFTGADGYVASADSFFGARQMA